MSPTTWFRLLGLSCLLSAGLFAVPALPQGEKQGKKYALLVGVNEYKGKQFGALRYAVNDVEKLAEILTKGGFDKVRVLSTARGGKEAADAPTAANIKKAIAELVEDKGRNDTVLVALSGHGANVRVDDPEEKGKPKVYPFFCPHDASTLGVSYSTGRSKFLVNLNLDLFDQLEQCGARNKLVLIDACRTELKAKDATRSFASDKVSIPGGVGVMFSCSNDERAWESEKLKHGVFFYFVLEGLRGKAKNEDREVTWPDLVAYVTRQVERQVGDIIKGGASQTPHALGNVRGAPLLLRVVAPPPDDKGFTNGIGMKFVRVKKGKFTMGSPKGEKERGDDEQAHEVEITRDFYLGVHEVTQGQFREVTGFNPSYFSKDGKKAETGKYFADPAGGKEAVKDFTQKELDEFPVENVSWDDAQEFLTKLNALAAEKEKGRVYRLPTEAEWEYACRGGPSSSTKPFHFKSPSDSLGAGQANFDASRPYGGKKGDESRRTNTVGKNGEANALGLFDMHGNVREWCSDWYAEDTYTREARRDPLGPLKGSDRVVRGGSWSGNGGGCRSASRGGYAPGYRNDYLGFRLALVPREK